MNQHSWPGVQPKQWPRGRKMQGFREPPAVLEMRVFKEQELELRLENRVRPEG